MGRGFEDVRPDEVHEVDEGVLAAKAKHTEGHVFDRCTGGLSVDQVSVKRKKTILVTNSFSLINPVPVPKFRCEYPRQIFFVSGTVAVFLK